MHENDLRTIVASENETTGLAEQCYLRISDRIFGVAPKERKHLSNYGFGQKSEIEGILPYVFHENMQYQNLSEELKKIFHPLKEMTGAYPIIAGSSLYLGVTSERCEDIDLVSYVEISSKLKEREKLSDKIATFIRASTPNQIKLVIDPEQPKQEQAEEYCCNDYDIERHNIEDFLNEFFPPDNTQNRLRWIIYLNLKWKEKAFGKPVTLKLHFIHNSQPSSDIHPHQEHHVCNVDDFFHTNRNWLCSSLKHYVEFLARSICRATNDTSPLKNTKRAYAVAGVIGDTRIQKILHDQIIEWSSEAASGISGGTEITELRTRLSEITSASTVRKTI